ncbi:MAG: PQQ-dependent sugar dehydrogenase [Spirosomataceae bacterium]
MKTLRFFLAFAITKAFGQVNPPSVLPTSAFINYGGSVMLTASGCGGTVNWSDGQTGGSVTVSPKQSTRISATCTNGGQTSAPSNSVLIQVGLTTSPCNSNVNVTSPIANTGYKYESANTITGAASIEANASVQFKAQNSVLLNPGFQVKTGGVFKAFTGGCSELQTRQVAGGLQFPWEILWGPDNFIWMTERGGKISRVNPQTGAVQTLLTIPDIYSDGEGGLLGMVLHPDFASNPFVYVTYNYNPPQGAREKIVRFTYNNANNTLGNAFVLLQDIAANVYHNGSRLVITPDLKLFVTTGDAGMADAAQNPAHLSGKILRMNLDGTIPGDNPIPGSPVWSIGHRNPQGMVYANGKLYCSSHGGNIEDEINLLQQSGNYGWPNVEGPCNTPSEITFCNANSVIPPIFSSGGVTWAFCGLDYYNNDAYPRWKNNLLMVSLKNQTFYTFQLSIDGNTIVGSPTLYFVNQFGRLRDIAVSPSGKVYLCTSNGGNIDKIVEITPVVE